MSWAGAGGAEGGGALSKPTDKKIEASNKCRLHKKTLSQQQQTVKIEPSSYTTTVNTAFYLTILLSEIK